MEKKLILAHVEFTEKERAVINLAIAKMSLTPEDYSGWFEGGKPLTVKRFIELAAVTAAESVEE